jgi:hypothetical protein
VDAAAVHHRSGVGASGDRRIGREHCVDAKLICVVSVDVDREVEAGFNEWYDQHQRDVVACPGWVRAARYRCLDGEPRYLALYEIESRVRGAFGPMSTWTPEMQRIQQVGYEEYWPHIESYRARTYELVSQAFAPGHESR